ncbi:MAG: transporter substrate-binding domain-containing protein [Alphaproteobacteria bacterium]|nr:transporter substrate-binding domain-containing protein [Alphaproteobacteria bacterium]
MKKICWVLLSVALLSATVVSAKYIQSQKKPVVAERPEIWRGCDEYGKALKIATFSTNPPFGWTEIQEDQSFARGFGVDLFRKIAKEKRINVRTVGFKSDADMRKAFESGKIDIWVGSYYDPKIRGAGHMYITPAFIPNAITVVFLKNKARPIKSFEDLKDLKGAVRQDEQFYPYIRLSIPKDLQLQEVFDSKEAFTKLITGEVDYLLSSPYSAEAEARRFKLNRDIELISTPLLGQELFVVYSRNSLCPQYRKDFAEGLREKRQDLNALKRSLIGFIDTWGQRFRDEPSLIDQLKAEGTLPKDFVLDTSVKKSDDVAQQPSASAATSDAVTQDASADKPDDPEQRSETTSDQKE